MAIKAFQSDQIVKAWTPYSHLSSAAATISRKLYHGLRGSNIATDSPGQFEFESRFATINSKTGKMETGVTQSFYEQSLQMMHECEDWKVVIQAQEVRDYYYYVPTENGKTRYVRTRVEFPTHQQTSAGSCALNDAYLHNSSLHSRTSGQSIPTTVQPTIQHTVKHKIANCETDLDIHVIGTTQAQHAVLPHSIRVSLNWEENIPPQLIPKSVTVACVRIKHPIRFLYVNRKNMQSRPIWSYDFAKTWQGPTADLAEMAMKACQPTYEIETECMDPIAYMKTVDKDEDYTATSLLLKTCDFLQYFDPPLGNYMLNERR